MNHTQHIATGVKGLRGNEILAAIQATKEGTMVAIKPLCTALNIDWANQWRKLQGNPRFSCSHMTITGADGKRYEMVCLPAEQVADWVNSINARKVNPEKAQALLDLQKFFQYAINEFVRERYVTLEEHNKVVAVVEALTEQLRILQGMVMSLQNAQEVYNDSEQMLASVGGKMMARARRTKPLRILQ